MVWTVFTLTIAVVMVITGSINTLSTKWADRLKAVGRTDSSDDDLDLEHNFDHPFFQAVGMFIGELSCLVAYFIKLTWKRRHEDREFGRTWINPLVFAPASVCDMFGTSLMYVGLNLTFSSSFQMLRGAVIIFTALLSVAFLGHTIRKIMWLGIVSILFGLGVVGLADVLDKSSDKENSNTNAVIAGDLLIIMAQIIVAVQMVYEEKYITKYRADPLQVVGYEGLFGCIFMGLALIPLYYIQSEAFSKLPMNRLEDPVDAFKQIANNKLILVAVLGNIVSIAVFNFSGITITKKINATTRMVLDSVRTIVIWVFAIAIGWQNFQKLAILGFILLFVGMCLYNRIIIVPFFTWLFITRRQRTTELENIDEDNDQTNLIPDNPGVQSTS